jgi:hypothetical protein
MFGNWLNGIDKKTKDRIHIGVSALVWSIWRCRNNIFLTMLENQISCRLSIWLRTAFIYGPYCSGGPRGTCGYWMQPFADCGTKVLQRGWPVAF